MYTAPAAVVLALALAAPALSLPVVAREPGW